MAVPDVAVPQVRSRARTRRSPISYLLTAPAMGYLLLIMGLPLIWAVFVSLTDKRVGADGNFIGLKNYTDLLVDPLFWKTFKNTVVFTMGAVVVKVFFRLIMALVLNEPLRGRSVYRVLMFLPWTLPTIVSVFTWQWMFSDVGGVLNALAVKLPGVDEPIKWLSSPGWAMVSVIIVNAWRGIPFLGIAILAGLQAVPTEQYEAAHVDGANVWQRFTQITLPSIKNVVLLAATITTIWTLSDFEIIWLLTRGGPSDATQVFSTLSYTIGFLNLDIGKAIAVAVLSIPFLIVLINIVTKTTLEEGDE